MTERPTQEQLDALRRLVGQVRHTRPWSVSLEWFPADSGVDLPEGWRTDLVEVAVHQAGAEVVLDRDGHLVADVMGAEEALAIGAAVTWLPAVLDEVEGVRADAAALARIIQSAGDLLLQGHDPTDIAQRLIASVEGEHRLVVDGEPVVTWKERDLTDVALEFEQLLEEHRDA